MCGIFGILNYSDTKYTLTGVLDTLGKRSITRGKDATGVAFLKNDKIVIAKEPIPSTQFMFDQLPDSNMYMGHVRQATSGTPLSNYNNHPFLSRYKKFALAHNGILFMNAEIKAEHAINESKIETDTYIAVQLMDKFNCLATFKSITFMCENVIGEFVFTIMNKESMYIAKNGNPVSIFDFYKLGLMIYASSKEILKPACEEFTQLDKAIKHGEFSRIKINDGEILKLSNGMADTRKFDTSKSEDLFDKIYDKELPCDICKTLDCFNCEHMDKLYGETMYGYNPKIGTLM